MRLVFASLFLVISSLSHAQLGAGSNSDNPFAIAAGPAFLPVEEAYQLEVATQAEGLRLYWQIADAYYLYQHQFKFTLQDSQGPVTLQADFPPALERSDEYFGDTRVYYNNADINLATSRHSGEARLQVMSQGCADAGLCYPPRSQNFKINFDTGTVTEVSSEPTLSAAGAKASPDSSPRSFTTVLSMMALAFFGGSLLNLMPCVFPVLSLKVLGFADASPASHHRQSWIYAAGVVTSFIIVASVLITLQEGGQAVGWGFQLQSPGFVIALAYLFLVMGLALSGVVELGSNFMNTGASLADRKGDSGSFFTGVLAVVVASPCTAPLMGTALGFAITQPAFISLSVFAALGAGMAAPLLVLSYSGLARRLMPKPGQWMETMKQFLAFPLYASAVWLLWVAGRQAGVDTMAAALLGGLFLALALWLWRSSWWRRGLAVSCLVVAAGLGLWRGSQAGDAAQPQPGQGIAWSPQSLQELRGSGQAVFVDVTADWCITCIANEKAVLHTDEIRAAFKDFDVAYMVADWTNYDAGIAAFLREHGRNGIPLYVLYPADPSAEAIILPQLLRKRVVLDALAAISSEKPADSASL